MQLSSGTHAKCSERALRRRTAYAASGVAGLRRSDAGSGIGWPTRHAHSPQREGFRAQSAGKGSHAADAADAQAHANSQKTRTMRTTSLFLLLIRRIVRKFPFFAKKCNIINSFTPGLSKGAFEEGTEKLLKTGKKWVRKGCFWN